MNIYGNPNHFRASDSQMVGNKFQCPVMWSATSIFITTHYVFSHSAVMLVSDERTQLGFKSLFVVSHDSAQAKPLDLRLIPPEQMNLSFRLLKAVCVIRKHF